MSEFAVWFFVACMGASAIIGAVGLWFRHDIKRMERQEQRRRGHV